MVYTRVMDIIANRDVTSPVLPPVKPESASGVVTVDLPACWAFAANEPRWHRGCSDVLLRQYDGVVFYHNDHLGTPQRITNQQQEIVWEAEYSPFGEADITTATIENNIRFPGQYYDQETNLHYNWHRYYDPATGRYITSDRIGLGDGPNTYLYGQANPLKYTDPTGENSVVIRGAFLTGASLCARFPRACIGTSLRAAKAIHALSNVLSKASDEEEPHQCDIDGLPGDPEGDPGCISRMMSQGWSYQQAVEICRGPLQERTGDNRQRDIQDYLNDKRDRDFNKQEPGERSKPGALAEGIREILDILGD